MNNTFADRLTALMEEKRMKVSDLSAATGISEYSVRGYVTRNHIPRKLQLVRLAAALGVNPNYLMYGESEEMSLATLSEWEAQVIRTYRKMPVESQKFVDSIFRWEMKKK